MSVRRLGAASYLSTDYVDKGRLSSYWHQVDEVVGLNPRSVLCVGPGNPIVPTWLKDLGITVRTTEIIESPFANVHGDVRALPFADGAFDVVLCAQVLEHVDWSSVRGAVADLARVARVGMVVTLPRSRRRISASITLPFTRTRRVALAIWGSERRGIISADEHYWEIDQPGQSLSAVEALLEASGMELRRSYRVWELDYHHVFVLTRP